MNEETFEKITENNLKDHLIISQYDDDSFENIELCLGIDEGKLIFLVLLISFNIF